MVRDAGGREMAERLQAMAERGVEIGLSRGMDQVEIYASFCGSFSASIEADRLSRAAGSQETGAGVRVIKGGKVGFSYTSDPEDLAPAVERAEFLSRKGLTRPGRFADRMEFPTIDGLWDERVVNLEPEEGIEMCRELRSGCRDHDERLSITSGGIFWGQGAVAICNSLGLSASTYSSGLSSSLSVVIKEGDRIGTGFEGKSSCRLDIEPAPIVDRACQMALSSLNPRKLDREVGVVVLRPEPLSNLMESTLSPAFIGSRTMKGNSPFSNRVGEEVSSEEIRITDDPLVPCGINSFPFDDEGVATRKVDLVERGILKGYLFDVSSGEEFGAASTGNAVRTEWLSSGGSHKSPPITAVRNLTVTSSGSREDPLSQIDSGILIEDVLGAHTANPASGEFSVGSSILYLIEGGEVTESLKPVMVSGSMVDALKSVVAVGRDHKAMSGSLSYCGQSLPTMAFEGFRVLAG